MHHPSRSQPAPSRPSSSIRLTSLRCAALVCAGLLLAPLAALAGNGHITHGAGAINSSMGGAGTGLPGDVLGALFLNPALLAQMDGHQMSFGIELAQSEASTSSTVPTPFGPFSGSTEDDADLAPIPTVGWSYRPADGRVAFGFGLIGLAGFATDYPVDPTNPILAPQPQGLGAASSEYSLLKVPFAVAWQATPKLSLGASVNLGWATLEASPFGGLTPDCSSPTDCFFPDVDKDGAAGFGFQLGLLYQFNDKVGLGFSWASEQTFEDFTWNLEVANPNLPTFGTGRSEEFDLDAPQIFAVGLGLRPTEAWALALDVRWIGFEDTDGFRGGPFDAATGLPPGLGWDDIFVYAVGAEYQFPNGVALRAGYNLSDSAITPDSTFFNVQSPAAFEDHYTFGLGIPVYDKLNLDFGYYHVPDNAVSGPFQSPFGPVPGTRIENEISIDSILMSFTFDL